MRPFPYTDEGGGDARAIRSATPLRKDYRKPRRWPAHLRTKTGCLTCKQALRIGSLDRLFTNAAISNHDS